MRVRFLMTMGTAAAVVALLSLTPISVAGQARTAAPTAPPTGTGTPAKDASAGAKPSPAKAKTWTPRRLPDGQPDISGVWLAQGIGTEPKVGDPFDANSSAALIADRLREAVATGGTLSGVSRCSNVYWDPKPDLTIPKGIVDPPDGEVSLTPFGLERKAVVKAFQAQKDRPTTDQFQFWVSAGDETCMPGTPYPMFNVLPGSGNMRAGRATGTCGCSLESCRRFRLPIRNRARSAC